ncbi:MAG: GNAT family N-acetyltransferase [Thioalkalivibrio sp.]|nr:GNAT family N-acetyltransferase [Thioalkalivibrio sp.]
MRNASVTDVPKVKDFGHAVLPAHYTPIIGSEAAAEELKWWSDSALAEAAEEGRLFIACSENNVDGVCESGTFGDEFVIWKLYVSPDVRGRGLGGLLLRAALSSTPAGTKYAVLEHFAGNQRAAEYYERLGFQVSRIDPHDSGAPELATVWRRAKLSDLVSLLNLD